MSPKAVAGAIFRNSCKKRSHVNTYPAFSDATIDIWGSLASCKGEGPERGTSGAMFCSVFAVMPAT